MTWQEGKSEDFREILRCGKRNKMPYVGYEGVENLQISLKIDTKKTLSKSVLVWILINCENGFLFTC